MRALMSGLGVAASRRISRPCWNSCDPLSQSHRAWSGLGGRRLHPARRVRRGLVHCWSSQKPVPRCAMKRDTRVHEKRIRPRTQSLSLFDRTRRPLLNNRRRRLLCSDRGCAFEPFQLGLGRDCRADNWLMSQLRPRTEATGPQAWTTSRKKIALSCPGPYGVMHAALTMPMAIAVPAFTMAAAQLFSSMAV